MCTSHFMLFVLSYQFTQWSAASWSRWWRSSPWPTSCVRWGGACRTFSSLSTPHSSGPPGHAGIAVGILPHMAAKSVELWRKSKVWVVGRTLDMKSTILLVSSTNSLDRSTLGSWSFLLYLVRWGAHRKVGVPCEVPRAIPSTRALKRLRSRMMSATGRLLIRLLLPSATSTLTEITYLP